MSLTTVYPDMVVRFAETITEGIGDQDNMMHLASPATPGEEFEAISLITELCRNTRQLAEVAKDRFQKRLINGIDVAPFVANFEPGIARLDRVILQISVMLAAADGLQDSSSPWKGLVKELEELNKAMVKYRDLLKNAIATMKTTRSPISLQRVEEAQASYRKGETKPFNRTPGVKR